MNLVGFCQPAYAIWLMFRLCSLQAYLMPCSLTNIPMLTHHSLALTQFLGTHFGFEAPDPTLSVMRISVETWSTVSRNVNKCMQHNSRLLDHGRVPCMMQVPICARKVHSSLALVHVHRSQLLADVVRTAGTSLRHSSRQRACTCSLATAAEAAAASEPMEQSNTELCTAPGLVSGACR